MASVPSIGFIGKVLALSALGAGAFNYGVRDYFGRELTNNEVVSVRLDSQLGKIQTERALAQKEEQINARLDQAKNAFLAQLNTETENRNREVGTVQGKLDEQTAENTRLMGEVNQLSQNLELARNEVGNLGGRFNTVETEVNTTKDNLGKVDTRVKTAEGQITQTTEEVKGVKQTLGTKEDRNALVRAIEKVKPSCVMMSSTNSLWSGFFLKTNDGELYLASCSHTFKSPADFITTEIKVEGQGFSFKVTPPPFKDSAIAFFVTDKGPDLVLIPLTDEIKKTLPPGIGLTFRDFEQNPLREGERAFTVGNPTGLENTVTTRIITKAERFDPFLNGDKTPYIQIQPTPNKGDSGSALIDDNGSLLGTIVMGHPWDRSNNPIWAPQGYAVRGSFLKQLMERECNLRVMSTAEKIAAGFESSDGTKIITTGISTLPQYHPIMFAEWRRTNPWVDKSALWVTNSVDKIRLPKLMTTPSPVNQGPPAPSLPIDPFATPIP
jgi:hypothetical protein